MPSTKTNIPYRLEQRKLHNNKHVYYLVKDLKINGKKIKISKSIGSNKPTDEEVEKLSEKYAYEIEEKALTKEAEINSELFNTNYLDKKVIAILENIRSLYKKYTNLLTTDESQVYEQNFEIQYVHGTTSIEGNTLTFSQTKDLLLNEILPENKTLREVNEVQNFKKVKEYREKHTGKVTLEFIKELHNLIVNNIDYNSAGHFRRINSLAISGCELEVTPSELIESELTDIINKYYTNLKTLYHPFEEAILFHYRFEMIHPFTDGNGRVGREVLNYMLRKSGYPRLLFLGSERSNYIKMLKLGNEEKYKDMLTQFALLITNQRLDMLKANLEKIVIPPKKRGQLRIEDFTI
ncbi:MAG: Fic family protein [Candidatus Bathyarchaeota archaeon]|nr:Fic family protein [Candidatus Termiticorpusculum sp.]MCL2868780.1 Fic family protein [Candidatus Termiticorpusculum sp.]